LNTGTTTEREGWFMARLGSTATQWKNAGNGGNDAKRPRIVPRAGDPGLKVQAAAPK
jgi:hypothetical protein